MAVDLTETLAALGLTGKRFSLSQKRTGSLVSACFSDPVKAGEWLDSDADCYLCGNAVRPGTTGKPTEEDMAGAGILLVDCDPKKDSELDPDGTTQTRRDQAWNVASAVWDHFGKQGILVDSGRGAQVWLRVEPGLDRRGLLAWIRDEFKHPLVDIDATHDYSRLMRCPGTINTRTQEEVCLIDPGLEVPVTRADVTDLLVGWSAPTAYDIPEADREPPSLQEVRRYVTGRALELWREDPFEITTDRSRRDFTFLREIVSRGAPLAVASRLLHALPGAKANDRSDEGYWRSTVTAALTSLGDEKAADDVLLNVLNRVKADPDYLMKPETLKALARAYLLDHEAWLVLRGKLKRLVKHSGLGIGDLDKVVAARAREWHQEEQTPPDGLAVFTRASDGGKGCWKLRDKRGQWTWSGLREVQIVLEANGEDPDRAAMMAMQDPFTVDLVPFQPRILPGRVWNESNARFQVEPVAGVHVTWDQLYNVVGRGLDNDLASSEWARLNGVKTGGDYLRWWVGTMLQDPKSRRAYLFLFSHEQGTGKSMFFESLFYLIGAAVVMANKALTNDQFNNELSRAVVAFTEEIDLGKSGRGGMYNKIKALLLGRTVSLEAKGGQAYEVPNVLSLGQCANNQAYCPVYEGDDRITMFQVYPAEPSERMAKEVMLQRLKTEAPAFLHTLLNLPFPEPFGRYVVPPIMTGVKAQQVTANRNDLGDWLTATPEWVTYTLDGVVDAFRAHLEVRKLPTKFWSPQRIRRDLPFTGARTRTLHERFQNEFFENMTATEIVEKFGLQDPPRRLGKCFSTLCRVASKEWSKRGSGGSVFYSKSQVL